MCGGSSGRTVSNMMPRPPFSELATAGAPAPLAGPAESERARVARELHDVISHNVSEMVVQAAAARQVFARRPDQALAAIEAIEGAGREALAELRTLLGLHRAESERAPRTPQPTLERLPALVEQVRAAGLAVALDADPITSLPVAVDIAAFRIVQEALESVVRHGAASSAAVELSRTETRLDVAVTDDGGPRGPATEGFLVIRHRVHLLGGHLVAGPRPAGGFGVRAWLPVSPRTTLRAGA